MKIGLAIAPANAPPSAFVVFRDELDVNIRKVANLGYDGVEPALLSADQVNLPAMKALFIGGRHSISLGLIREAEEVLSNRGGWEPSVPMV